MIENKDNLQIIHELTEQFDFSELSEKQKEMVLSEISESDYSEMRVAVENTRHFFENEPELIADDLLKPVRAKKNIVLSIINYKIPIYKIAAAAALIFCFIQYIPNKQQVETTVEIVQIDESNLPDSSFTFIGVDNLKKHASNNSIKYNVGLAKLY